MNGHPLAHVPQRKHRFKSVPLRPITSEARERSRLTGNIFVLLLVGFAGMSGLIVFFSLNFLYNKSRQGCQKIFTGKESGGLKSETKTLLGSMNQGRSDKSSSNFISAYLAW